MHFRRDESSRGSRSGVSIVEFVGCLAALGGGLAMGLVYLGFDLRSIAVDTLDYVEAERYIHSLSNADDVNDEAIEKSTKPAGVTTVSTVVNNTSPHVNQSTDNNPVETQEQKRAVEIPRVEQPAAEQKKSTVSESSKSGDATKAYWTALVTCMKEERKHRKRNISNTGEWRLFDYINHRQVNHEKAIATLEALDTKHVDQKLIRHAKQILRWHQAGLLLYSRAGEILSDNNAGSLTGPTAQSWQSAATQHRMEERLVQEKHSLVASYLNTAYKLLAPFTPAALR